MSISYQQLQKDAEAAQKNARMTAIATALQGKYALVRVFDSLALIYSEPHSPCQILNLLLTLCPVLAADSLLAPGSKRLTAFDIQISAMVYSRTSSSNFTLSNPWKTFVAYDLVALFNSPFHPSVASRQQSLLASASWLSAIQTLEARASEPGRGGFEGLPSVFADEQAMNNLLRSAGYSMAPAQMTRPCAGRRESYGAISPLTMPRLSVGH